MLSSLPTTATRSTGRLLGWLAPLLLLVQYLGNFPKDHLMRTGLYLALFAGVLWLGRPGRGADEREAPNLPGRIGGGILVAAGAVAMLVGLLRIFDVALVTDWFQGDGWLARRPGRILLPTLAAWPVALGLPWLTGRRLEPRDYIRLGALIALPLLALLVTGENYQGLTILKAGSTGTWLAGIAAGLAILAAALRPNTRPALLLGGLLLGALALRALGLSSWEIHPGTRDMLPLIETAHEALLAGQNPYDIHQMQKGSQIPLTYLPGLWLGYLGPEALGLDIRWMGLLADVAVVASLWWVAGRPDPADDGTTSWPRAVAVGLGAVWLFLPSVHWNGIYAEPHLWWGILALWLASIVRQRWWVAAALTGLAVSTRHFGVVLLPFVLVTLLRHVGWRRAIPRLALAGAVAALLLLPAIVADPHTFWFGTFEWLREYGPAHQSWFHKKLGLAGPLYEAGHHDWLLPIQAAGVGLLALAHALWPTDGSDPGGRFLGFAGTAYVFFVAFNGIIWDSFYLGVFLFAGLACVAAASDGPDEPADAELDERWWRASAVVFAATLLAGGWIAYTLYQFQSDAGKGQVVASLADDLASDDILIDRTARQLAFIDEPGLEDLATTATKAGGLFDPKLLLDGQRREVWVAARTAWNRRYLDRMAELGEVRSRRQFGRYTLLEVAIGPVDGRLSRRLDALTPTWRARGDGSTHNYKKKTAKKTPVWRAEGLPGWVEVRPRRCKIGPLDERLLYVHPHNKADIRLTWSPVELGGALLLYGGIRNGAVRWNRAPVDVDLYIDGQRQKSLRLPNLRGPRWTAIDTSKWSGESHDVTLAVTTPKDSQRWTCLEGAVLR